VHNGLSEVIYSWIHKALQDLRAVAVIGKYLGSESCLRLWLAYKGHLSILNRSFQMTLALPMELTGTSDCTLLTVV
jgi:hypothetical protein